MHSYVLQTHTVKNRCIKTHHYAWTRFHGVLPVRVTVHLRAPSGSWRQARSTPGRMNSQDTVDALVLSCKNAPKHEPTTLSSRGLFVCLFFAPHLRENSKWPPSVACKQAPKWRWDSAMGVGATSRTDRCDTHDRRLLHRGLLLLLLQASCSLLCKQVFEKQSVKEDTENRHHSAR